MFDDDDDDANYAAGAFVSEMEHAGEAIGQMMTGAHSSLLWCPRCRQSGGMTAISESGVTTEYDCHLCGKTTGADEIL